MEKQGYRLLIVDDERLDREGLYRQLKWSDFGIEWVETAKSGKEALSKQKWFKADIIYTDVKMPGMNGIEMAKKIKEFGAEPIIIFVSGYDDFGFVKSAINLGAVEYVLKPVQTGELTEVTKKAVERLEIRKKEETERSNLKNLVDLSRPIVKNQILTDYLKGEIDNKEYGVYEENLKMNFDQYKVAAGVIELSVSQSRTGSREDTSVIKHIDKKLAEWKEEFCETVFIKYSLTKKVLFYIGSGESLCLREEALASCRKIIEWVKTETGIEAVFAVSEEVMGSGNIRLSFLQGEKQLAKKMAAEADKISVENETDSLTGRVIEQVEEYVAENYMNEISLKQIAKELFYSPNHLGLIIKKNMGCGFGEYLTRYRMKRAAEFLTSPRYRVSDVARLSGYKSTNAFTIKFKEFYKVSPMQYRQGIRKL